MFCILCAGGEFSDREGQGSCDQCNAGKYRPSGGEFNLCVDCPLGWSSGEGFRDCEHCPDGRYSPQNRTVCEGCPSGYYSKTTTGKCTACAVGQYSTPQQKKCDICQKGTYTDKIASEQCASCKANGEYTDEMGATSCKQCPPYEPVSEGDACGKLVSVCLFFFIKTSKARCSEITGSLFKARLVDQRFFLASDLVLFSHKLKPDIFFFSIRVLGN